MSADATGSPSEIGASTVVQFAAWLIGLAVCLLATLFVRIGEWDQELALVQFVMLIIAVIPWGFVRPSSASERSQYHSEPRPWRAWGLALMVAVTSWTTCRLVGSSMIEMPPAYHDEYSYLFQAKTLLTGRFWVPSHASHPELFDQMHVLNEGRMASRYYPGTGLWLAPFVTLHHPYWGHFLASSLASVFVFWTGYELGGLLVATVSGFTCALSPGIALFANLLLAHQPTLLGLTVFLWAFVKWQRTRTVREAFFAGCGLSWAMLCRPATAAGFGLPFGIAFVAWLISAREHGRPVPWSRRLRVLLGMGVPIAAGWCLMLAYNKEVTGHWASSPYQVYTDIYTPRHVYGFNNVVRGEQKIGPKVITAYDRWAENLTPDLAAYNVMVRCISSWTFTFDLLPQLICIIIVLGSLHRVDRRWLGIVAAIVSLHAMHVPYWYVGIMGWHYVFETAPLLCLILGLATGLLLSDWHASGRWLMPAWWFILLLISLAGDYFPLRQYFVPTAKTPRISVAIDSIRIPRERYAQFDLWLKHAVKDLPALVFIDADPDDQHVDYVVNSPTLDDPILRARFRRGVTDIAAIERDFPGRSVYLCQPDQMKIIRKRRRVTETK